MKYSSVALLLLQVVRPVFTHYVFSKFLVNGTETDDWQYVRNVTAGPDYDYPGALKSQIAPQYEVYSNDLRCGRNAHLAGPNTDTATVVAGSEVGMRIGVKDYGVRIFHDGPGQAYLSRSPSGDVGKYDGSGDWFKIAYIGPLNDTLWRERDTKDLNFTIPKTTPPGKYLLRVEQIYLQSAFNSTQFYVNCAQIDVRGEGTGTPGPMVKFPGEYDPFDASIWTKAEWGQFGKNLRAYMPPGPPVWNG